MYVYRQSEPSLWTVGFYTPDGRWITDSDHDRPAEAAERIHFLNGNHSQQLTTLRRQADELAGALKILLAWANIQDEHSERARQVRDKALAALARAEGSD